MCKPAILQMLNKQSTIQLHCQAYDIWQSYQALSCHQGWPWIWVFPAASQATSPYNYNYRSLSPGPGLVLFFSFLLFACLLSLLYFQFLNFDARSYSDRQTGLQLILYPRLASNSHLFSCPSLILTSMSFSFFLNSTMIYFLIIYLFVCLSVYLFNTFILMYGCFISKYSALYLMFRFINIIVIYLYT